MATDYVIVDLETTGLDIEREEIIEIAAVLVRRGLIMDRFSTLVSCSKPLSPQIVALTNITDDMLVGQPDVYQAVDMLAQFAGDADLVAHSAGFDGAFLRKYWADGRQWLDTITLAQIAFPCFPSYSLVNLCSRLDIPPGQSHRALDDAVATAELFIRIDKELDRLPQGAKEDIALLAEGDESPSGDLLRRKCASVATNQGEAVPTEEKQPRSSRKEEADFRFDPEQLSRLLSQAGAREDLFPEFEDRPQQLHMSLAVADVLNEGGSLLAEAGTGIGKSLAYLLPAALYSAGGGQVAISTHTRNLQEQLLDKDIPLAAALLGRAVRAALVKGRSNYLCRRLYKYLLHNCPENMRYFLMRVAVWRSQTKTGDGGELSLTSYDRWRWQRLCASRENCAPFCPYSRRNSCLVQRVRGQAAQADIIVVNHSLLVANASMDSGFLPAVENIIIDEAQHLAGAAEEQFTANVDIYQVLDVTSRLIRREKGRSVGAVPVLRKQVQNLAAVAAQMGETLLDNMETGCDQLVRSGEAFFQLLELTLKPVDDKLAFFPVRQRVLPALRLSDSWPLIQAQGEQFSFSLRELSRNCYRLLELFTTDEEGEERPPGSEELHSVAAIAIQLADSVSAWLEGEDDNYVYWTEFPDRERRPSIAMAPIEIGSLLSEHLYSGLRSLVLTSATLSVGRDFSYFRRRLGLEGLDMRELNLASPFHYRDQALFTVVNDLPDWTSCGALEAAEAISSALVPLLCASSGRAIVLFTSHYQLKAVYEKLRQPLREQGVTVLAHGVSGDPRSLLERLKTEERCCILGANSFWEGVDVSGPALSLIVVVRLPFWPPNSPLALSRMERLEAEGRNSFYEYSLPQALIRFKQGFGRLIRSQSDSGVFCVLDRRILEKSYGSRFIRCLPDMARCVGDSGEIAERIRKWLE